MNYDKKIMMNKEFAFLYYFMYTIDYRIKKVDDMR